MCFKGLGSARYTIHQRQDLRKMTKFHLFSQDSVRLETAPTGGVRKS